MAFVKGSHSKYSKRHTDVNAPEFTTPKIPSSNISLSFSENIDNNAPINLYFHIFEIVPSFTKLYIYGELFNQNFYTEIGRHAHTSGTLSTGSATISTSHGHSGSIFLGNHRHTGGTGNAGLEYLTMHCENGPGDICVETQNSTRVNRVDMLTQVSNHTHAFTAVDTDLGTPGITVVNNNIDSHTHGVASGSVANYGLLPGLGSLHTSGTAKQYFDSLKIYIDGVDRTVALLAYVSLVKFGDGTASHVLVTTGVELDISPYVTTLGQHKITFLLNTGSPNNGGKLHYNLYTIG